MYVLMSQEVLLVCEIGRFLFSYCPIFLYYLEVRSRIPCSLYPKRSCNIRQLEFPCIWKHESTFLTPTFFINKSKTLYKILFQLFSDGLVRKRSQMQLAGSKSSGDLRIIKKASSCSTIYIDDSTVSQPNLKNTIKVVSLAIYYHIKNRTSNQVLDIFDEKLHPLTVSYTASGQKI